MRLSSHKRHEPRHESMAWDAPVTVAASSEEPETTVAAVPDDDADELQAEVRRAARAPFAGLVARFATRF